MSDDPVVSEAQRNQAMHLGISFNGTQFIYRDFKYDKLPDAIAYAALDSLREGRQPAVSSPPEWLERALPSAADEALMKQYGICFEGWRYRYRDFLYDRLADAINYARRQVKP